MSAYFPPAYLYDLARLREAMDREAERRAERERRKRGKAEA